jgi:prepilin-type N-terminal cleavage/methylation domain-containing protein
MSPVRNGFTLIELLVILAILAIVVSLIAAAVGGFSGGYTFEAEVTDKWTDLDADSVTLYRIRTVSPNGDVGTWNSYWCHNDIQVGVSYQFQATGSYLRKANRLAIQPVRVSNE